MRIIIIIIIIIICTFHHDTRGVPHDCVHSIISCVLHHFPEFMAFYFPQAHAQIDWSLPHVFLDQELAALSADAELGKRLLDKLVSVRKLDGDEQWVLVHLEVQGWRDADFAERMFIYNYRVYDRYRHPVASMALLTDENRHWRPTGFGWAARCSLIFRSQKCRITHT